jgi:hypothetical protein
MEVVRVPVGGLQPPAPVSTAAEVPAAILKPPVQQSFAKPVAEPRQTFKVLYLFAGAPRKSSIAEAFRSLSSSSGGSVAFEFTEIDISRDPRAHDLKDPDLRSGFLDDIARGVYDLVIASPPCNTWSRAVWANNRGPHPIRSDRYPLGFPWLEKRDRAKVEDGNILAFFSVASMKAVSCANLSGHNVIGLLEHPERLGKSARGTPASIWQLPEVHHLYGRGFSSVACFQCHFGASTPKPTIFLSNVKGLEALGYAGLPEFDNQGLYVGPLPRDCGHKHPAPLVDKDKEGNFRTGASAQYPHQLNAMLAHLVLNCLCPPLALTGGVSSSRFGAPPTRGDHIRNGPLVVDQVYIGRGDHSLARSRWANPFSIEAAGSRPRAINFFGDYLDGSPGLRASLQSLSGQTLRCHCSRDQSCHADKIIEAFRTASEEFAAGGHAPDFSPGRPAKHKEKQRERVTPGVIQGPYKSGLRDFHDGAGLCSPGRFPKHLRQHRHPVLEAMGKGLLNALRRWDVQLRQGEGLQDLRQVLFALALGKFTTSPFPKPLVDELRTEWEELLQGSGFPVRRHPDQRKQPTDVGLLESILKAAGDPDQAITGLLVHGVPLGVNEELPRLPEVFEEKVSWSVPTPQEGEAPRWMDNYLSARSHPEAVHKQFDKDVKAGLMIRVTKSEATRRWGDRLRVAALGAIEKRPGSDEVRVIYDGTHGVLTNAQVRVRDQLRFPATGDLQGMMHELSEDLSADFGLVYDITGAHRAVPVIERDWGLQACRLPGDQLLDGEEALYVNCVGTFGMVPAAYWWARVAGAAKRSTHYLLDQAVPLWHVLFADDGCLADGFPQAQFSILANLLSLLLLGLEVNWSKVKGGVSLDYIGYRLCFENHLVVLSERRASWLVEWLRRKASEGSVLMRELREVLGRLSFASGPLRWIRPYLGPLYAWCAVCPMGSYHQIPEMLRLIFTWLATAIEARRMVACRVLQPTWKGELIRTDAKAEGDLIVIGGWSLRHGLDPSLASWFSFRITRSQAPWLFVKEPFRFIASLERLASLVGTMLLIDPARGDDLTEASIGFAASTDNQGNARLVERHMTTKLPLALVLLELSTQLQQRNMVMKLEWLERGANQPADDLTNGEFKLFSASLRVQAEWETLEFAVLPQLLEHLGVFRDQVAELKSNKVHVESSDRADTAKRPRLRERDPW